MGARCVWVREGIRLGRRRGRLSWRGRLWYRGFKFRREGKEAFEGFVRLFGRILIILMDTALAAYLWRLLGSLDIGSFKSLERFHLVLGIICLPWHWWVSCMIECFCRLRNLNISIPNPSFCLLPFVYITTLFYLHSAVSYSAAVPISQNFYTVLLFSIPDLHLLETRVSCRCATRILRTVCISRTKAYRVPI